MKKTLLTLVAGLYFSTFVNATTLEDQFFSAQDNPELTTQEKQALAIAKQWRAGDKDSSPVLSGQNGTVQFIYGTQYPSIVCAVLQVCDIELQPGEFILNTSISDSARWILNTVIGNEVHFTIKPTEVGLNSTLIILTTKRAYHLRLKSHKTDFMPHVSFIYPEEQLKAMNEQYKREQQAREANTIPETQQYIGDLSFDYDIKGDADWKPVRVYNDGKKTFIQMPDSMQQTEAPTLLVVRREGSLFKEPETVMVNYRLQDNKFIVDTVFNQAILIAGVGKHQDKITITKEDK